MWVYCPEHAGVQLSDRADHLAGSGPATACLELGTQDIQLIIRDTQLRCRQVGGGGEDERERATAGLGGEVHLPRPRGTHHVSVGHGHSLSGSADQEVPAGRSRGCLGPPTRPPSAEDAIARPVIPVSKSTASVSLRLKCYHVKETVPPLKKL